jgi:hypothetical protein
MRDWAFVALMLVILVALLLNDHFERQHDLECVEAGFCEWAADEDGDPVIRVKPEEAEG